jgi:uncharacterized protein YndB with AHSA1/START domain
MMPSEIVAEPSVRRSVRVRASVERAFRVYTAELDSWWPKTHHIGSSPMTRAIMEGRVGGRCYSEQADGTECPWGQVLVWEPPLRFVMAWQVSPTWQFEPDLARCSEVEVNFTPVDDGTTLVELEHRYFSRHGEGFAAMREQVNAAGGWGSLLEAFKGKAEEGA